MKKTLLVCNGEPPSRRLTRLCASRATFLIAADGGAGTARRHGVVPDVILGDLDSVSARTRRYFSTSSVLRVPSQEKTDLEKALDFIGGGAPGRVLILGATGRRLDFTVGNLCILWRYVRTLTLALAGDGWWAVPLTGRRGVFRAPRGTTVSLLPFSTCRGVTLRGLKYPLHGATLRLGDAGISNEVCSSSFRIEMRAGRLLMVVLSDLPLSGGHPW